MQLVLPLVESQFRVLSHGETGLILLRVGRALRRLDPDLSAAYLERALLQSQLTETVKNRVVNSSWTVKSEEDKFDAMYREFQRQQEVVEKRAILEFASFDLARARDMVALVQRSEAGFQRLLYGDEIRPIPFPPDTNTYLIASLAKRMADADLQQSVLFFSQNFVRLEEPVFSPAIDFVTLVTKKDPIAGEQVVGLLRDRAERLLKHKNRAVVLQTHVALADFLARVPDQGFAGGMAQLALGRVNEGFARDLPAALKFVAAQAYHQYWLGLSRFDSLETEAAKFRTLRNQTLSELGRDVSDFEKSQLTVDVTQDPRKFAQAMSFRSREFAEQLVSDMEVFELKYRGGASIEQLEKMYVQAKPSQKLGLAMFLNERLYPTDPAKAEQYLREARTMVLENPDFMSRILAQTLLHAQAMGRCSDPFLRVLASDALKTADELLKARDLRQQKQAVFLGNVLGPFFLQWATVDFSGATEKVPTLGNAWLRAHLYTTLLEAAVAEEGKRVR